MISPRMRLSARETHAVERVDIHCHCLAGLDDGPAALADSLALCRDLVADGITTAIATPHQLGCYDGQNQCPQIRAAVAELGEALAAEGIDLRVMPGADVRIDERIPDLVSRDEVMTLCDAGRYLLLELPGQVQINPTGLVRQLHSMGVIAILTHPERNPYLAGNPGRVLSWIDEGALLQLTAGSVVGAFGPLAEAACWYWLDMGVASLVATDCHGMHRRPCMSQAFGAVLRRLGPSAAARVCVDNPRRVLEGQPTFTLGSVPHTEAQV